jgi:Tol biopolymer transport system component/imidazolonepropionase-like amidohydrolase
MSRRAVGLAMLWLAVPCALAAKESPRKAGQPKDPAADINAPRANARRIAFTTTQGTWTSLDVAPDGRTLVFDLLGDLYSLPIAGGKAVRLTSGPAWDVQPRFSPDGKTIAFTSDRSGIDNLWTIDADGRNARAITEEKDVYVRSPDWTPDGGYLVARREEGKTAGIPPVELFIYHRQGGSGVKLTSADEISNCAGPVASSDGRFIYFSRRQRGFSYLPNLQDGLWQVARYDRMNATISQVTEGFGGGARPVLSHGGDRLAYLSRRDGKTVLVLRDLGSGRERVLARDLAKDEMEGFAQSDLYPGYDFLPDDSAILISDGGKLARFEVETGARSEIPFTAEVEQWAAPRVAWQDGVARGPVAIKVLRRPGQSPDGAAIVFESLGQLWRQPVAAGKALGEPQRITSGARAQDPTPEREYAPAISPDGGSVAFVSWSDRDLGSVWRVPLAGGEPTRLTTEPGHYANPVWSPDGEKLAIFRGSGLEMRGRQPEEEQSFDLYVLSSTDAATKPAFVTSVNLGAGQIFHPYATFLEGGERLLFAQAVPGKKPQDEVKTDLVSVRLDGSDRKTHLRLPPASEIAPSPDGQWVAFTSRDNVYLTAWPPVRTAEPPEVSLTASALPVWRLSEPAGAFIAWADGGKTLTWTLGPRFLRLPIDRALAFVAEEKRKAAEKARAGEGGDAKPDRKGAKKDGAEAPEPDLKLPPADAIEIALTVPRAQPSGSFVLRGAKVVTMRGEEVLASADVVVTDNRIAAVGPAGTVPVPTGAASLDAAGTTIVPGLIDTHAHLHYSAFEIFPQTKWEYLANLAYGVTTTYDPSAPTIDVFAQAEMVEAGKMLGPRIYSSGMVLYGGQQTDIWAAVDSLEDARRQVRRMKAWGARMIKVYQQPRRAQRIWFAEAARAEKMLLTAEGGGELWSDLSMVADGFTAFEHSLPVELGEDSVRFLAESDTFYTPTLLVSYGGPWGELYYWQTRNPHDDVKLNRFVPHFALDNWGRRHPWIEPSEYQFPLVAEGVASVVKAGGNVALGAHGQLQGLGVHWELWAMAGDGGSGRALTPHEAWRTATAKAAEKLGLLPDLGTVEAGKLADLLVLEADPLADVHNSEKIRWVVKNGEIYEAATLRRIWPSIVEPPKQTWQN